MKKGLQKFTLTKTQIDNFENRFHHSDLFIVTNGCLEDWHYKPYRDIQISIIKQIIEKYGYHFSKANIAVNMDVTYESDEIRIQWNSWMPLIEIEDKLNNEMARIVIEKEQLNNNMEFIVF